MPHFQVVIGGAGSGAAVLVKKHLAMQSEVFFSKQLDCHSLTLCRSPKQSNVQ